MNRLLRTACSTGVLLALAALACEPDGRAQAANGQSYEAQVVASMPHYVPDRQVSGVIRVSGHGSAANPWMRQLLVKWQLDFQRFQPGVTLEYRMYGTSSAIPALFNGVADIAIPGQPLPPLVKEFLRFVLSDEGQKLIAPETGFLPLSAHDQAEQAQLLR